MPSEFRDNSEQFREELKRRAFKGLRAVAIEAWSKARELASVTNEGVRMRRKRNTARGSKGSQYTIYPHSSAPGEPPRRRTGFGQKNIVCGWNESEMTARVGFGRNAIYMAYHELGIQYPSGMQQRPTLETMLRQYSAHLIEIFRRYATQ